MKWIALTFFLLAFGTLQAQHHTTTERAATHGMVIFGTNVIYASHLPMFHPPHQYQVILELELDAEVRNKFLGDQKQHPEMLTYTLEPEKFVLPDMMHSPKPFRANIYRGHFERGGTKIIESLKVKIKRVLYFEKFDPSKSKDASGQYILFGNEQEQFAIHHISKAPDFDQIIRVRTTPIVNIELIILHNTNQPIGISGNTLETTVSNKKVAITLSNQIYLEFDDLAN